YLGDRVSEKVKTKVIELLYSWTVALPEESKIKDAYYMLKRQGIVMFDPVIPVDRTLIPSPPPRPKNPVFDDEEKSKLLAKLLKSKNPDDLQEANKLIKSMVKEDEARIQKVTKRMHTLEEVNNNVKLLNEMLVHYSKEDSSEADRELMKELYERCETKRRTLFKLASETEDNDSSLGDILQASDNLSRVINSYKKIIEGQVINGEVDLRVMSTVEGSNATSNLNTLIDLAGLDIPSTPPPPVPPTALAPAPTAAPAPAEIPILPPPPQTFSQLRSSSLSHAEAAPAQQSSAASSLSLLDEELLCLGLNDPAPAAAKETSENNQWSMFENDQLDLDFFNPKTVNVACNSAGNPLLHHTPQTTCGTSVTLPSAFTASQTAPSIPAPSSTPFVFSAGPAAPVGPPKTIAAAPGYFSSSVGNMSHKMDALGQLLEEAKGESTAAVLLPDPRLPVTAPGAPPIPFPSSCSAGSGSPLFQPASFQQQQGSPVKAPEISLANVHVPLESIKPSSALPVTAYDKNGFRILLHFARECPPGRSDVLVVVVSMLNTAPLPVKNIVLQAAVPKSMKVKLQPPSGTELAPFNPIQPPAAITQVMLLANPAKEKVRLRYRLTFTLGDQPSTEVGEVDQFPPVEQWGNL
ncbi:GGA3 protein, partial [Alectura lathami]|nr:GGA3 protein [Alectura lathami]